MQNETIEWWRKGTIYQVYPRSFSDSSNRGWGDLNGVRERLPYLASLGVDAVWISPFFKSPMKDFGYDVEDHRCVDPMFGTNEDFDALIAEARRLNIKIMVDLVLSHVSDIHPWFKEASKSRDSEYSDCFVWADAQVDGSPPNNWRAIFGGSAWTWSPSRRQYYLHNFLKSQPDLNFHNPRVRQEALSIARYWLDKGVSGFRLDTVNFYFHDQELRSNPASDCVGDNMAHESNPYSYQDHIYDKNRPEVSSFLAELGAVLKEYPGAVTLGEVGAVKKRSWALVREYTQENRLSLCYNFDLLGEDFDANYLRSVIEQSSREAPDAWPCWTFSNHDVPRSASRLAKAGARQDQVASLSTALLLSLRGTPCIYQGEELGLEEAEIAYEDLKDPFGIEFWPDIPGRDGCRTPMPWTEKDPNCGFNDGKKTWLPIPDAHRSLSVEVQEPVYDSSLNRFRRLLAMRSQETALQIGDLDLLDSDGEVLAYERSFDGEAIQCYFNLSSEPKSLEVPGFQDSRVFDGSTPTWQDAPAGLDLEPWGWVWLRKPS